MRLGSNLNKAVVVIPAFNEAKHIGEVVAGLREYGVPVTVVDDGCRDNTGALARAAGAEVISNGANQGKGVSLLKGFRHALDAGREFVFTFDGDGQHSPSLLPILLRAQEESGADVVIGRREMSWKVMPPVRFATNRCMSAVVTWMGGRRLTDTQCGLRLFRGGVLRALLFGPKPKVVSRRYDFESELLIEACYHKFRVVEVDIPTVYNGAASSIRPVVDTVRFFKMMARILWRR